MSEEEETYCRLCAEPTPREQLISSDDEVGLHSKIATKLSWINIEISASNNLPNTLCFACYDSLERTWSFLHNVRSAQTKLNDIFAKKCDDKVTINATENKTENLPDRVRPVNIDWEEFETKKEVKSEEDTVSIQIDTVDPNCLLNLDYEIKIEAQDDYVDNQNTSDSDVPLQVTVKRNRIKKKKKKKTGLDLENETNADSQNFHSGLIWDNYMCICANCDAQCKNIMSLRLHSLEIHTACCIFKCSDCGKVIANYKSFLSHVRLHNKLLRQCCEFCNKSYTRLSLLKKHLNTVHKNVFLYMCPNCGASFESEEHLHDHMILYTKNFKKRHLKEENMEGDLKCNYCEKEFKSRSNLQQHKLVHTQRSRDFSCHICGKMFFTKGTLSTHISTHEDTKPFKCEYCPLAFRARGNLQSHISLHSGVKPFICEQCGKSFRVKRHLKSHSIIHTDLMPYVCEYCEKTFRYKTRLNLHLRQHTGAKPYNCAYCQRNFTNGSNFKKHMKRRHNIDTSKKRYNTIVSENGNEQDNSNTLDNSNKVENTQT